MRNKMILLKSKPPKKFPTDHTKDPWQQKAEDWKKKAEVFCTHKENVQNKYRKDETEKQRL